MQIIKSRIVLLSLLLAAAGVAQAGGTDKNNGLNPYLLTHFRKPAGHEKVGTQALSDSQQRNVADSAMKASSEKPDDASENREALRQLADTALEE
ncbi:hypothetical protein [Agrilutibacter solisilvae]|uniref:DUF4148 domain-containing protein n=1 Tax=Agrilutibacter solisilvae TaxID=2763317 RepID=A0A974XX71_9GAMM|nr:hypothetical protein [Lysobacter solisilvae]QSX77481.1 hypothetical protein I8J32_012040 [Lysobacter solisilvae]